MIPTLTTALTAALTLATPPPALDSTTLPARLAAHRAQLPEVFKALVVRLAPGSGPGDAPVTIAYDVAGTSRDRDDWWPASSIKLYAAIAALEKTHGLGFTPNARVTFHYPDDPRTARLNSLIHSALVPSNNLAFDRLVEIVGFDDLNSRFFTAANGFEDTVLLRAYFGRVRHPELDTGTLRHSPRLELVERRRRELIAERRGRGTYDCPEEGNCTSLRDLAEAMRRLMLHEVLPAEQRYCLGKRELALLRRALSAQRKRGNGVVDGLRRGFGRVEIDVHHKPGYARKWFSDVVFVRRLDNGRRYVVAMAGYPGRDALDDASRAVGEILRRGELR